MKSLSQALLLLVVTSTSLTAAAQAKVGVSGQKLPSAEKVIGNYLKAIGGKKRVATIRDATYEWQIQFKDQPFGLAKVQTKAPASVLTEMIFGNGKVRNAANGRSAWVQDLDGNLRTLTGAEAAAVKLRASLDARRLVDVKKGNILARVISIAGAQTDAAFVVEFSLRTGARIRYWFSTTSKLLVRIEDDTNKAITKFEDYRTQGDILEPHRVRTNVGDGELVFVLQRAKYNTGIGDSVFDPPGSVKAMDVVTLLREVETIEWSDYQHFSGDVGDYKLDTPKTGNDTSPRKP